MGKEALENRSMTGSMVPAAGRGMRVNKTAQGILKKAHNHYRFSTLEKRSKQVMSARQHHALNKGGHTVRPRLTRHGDQTEAA
jgi:hypothetical protein